MPEHEYDSTLQSPSERRNLLREGALRLRRMFLPSSQGLGIGDNFLTAKDDGAGNIDPFWQRADGSESNLVYTDSEAIAAVPFVGYIPFGSEPITGQSYAP